MGLAHGLLDFLRISVDNQRGAFGEGEQRPSFLEYVGEGQEVEHTVALCQRHTTAVGFKGGDILAVAEHDALAVARRPARI